MGASAIEKCPQSAGTDGGRHTHEELSQMDTKKVYAGRTMLVNRGRGIVMRCTTKQDFKALLELLQAMFPAGGRLKDMLGKVAA